MGTKNQDFPKAGKALSFVPEGFNLDFKVFLWYFDGFSVILDGIFLEQNRGLNGAKIALKLSFGPPFSTLRRARGPRGRARAVRAGAEGLRRQTLGCPFWTKLGVAHRGILPLFRNC